MLLTRFYKYATEYSWFMRLGMIVSYVLSWFAFGLCMLILLSVPCAFLLDLTHKLICMGPYIVDRSSDFLQHDLLQNTFPNQVCRTQVLPHVLTVTAAYKSIHIWINRSAPVIA